MRGLRDRWSALLIWLRRPSRLIAEARAFLEAHPIQSLQDLEGVAERLGIPIHRYDPGFKIDGATTSVGGQLWIFVKPDLHPMRQQFTLAHELGHARLHATDLTTHADQIDFFQEVHGRRDVEADSFLFVCLTRCMDVPELTRYVLENPNMLARSSRVIRYFMFARVRSRLADFLEWLVPCLSAKGAA